MAMSALSRFAMLLVSLLLLAGLAGCPGDMRERYSKVRSACRAGDKDEAMRLTEAMRKSDAKFERKFQYVLSHRVGISKKNDYCDPYLLSEVEKELNNPDSRTTNVD